MEEKPKNPLELMGFLAGKMSGFTDEEKGLLDAYAQKHTSGEGGIAIPFGKGKFIGCAMIALRASETVEKHSRDGVVMVNDFLWGTNNPMSRSDILTAYCALKEFRRDFFKKIKEGK